MSATQDFVLTGVEQYHSEVLRLPRLTRCEETEFVRRARQGDKQAKDELIHSCLRYVAFVASRYTPTGVSTLLFWLKPVLYKHKKCSPTDFETRQAASYPAKQSLRIKAAEIVYHPYLK